MRDKKFFKNCISAKKIGGKIFLGHTEFGVPPRYKNVVAKNVRPPVVPLVSLYYYFYPLWSDNQSSVSKSRKRLQ